MLLYKGLEPRHNAAVWYTMANETDLRVDCTALYNLKRDNYLIIMNVNYNYNIITNATLFREALQKTANFIETAVSDHGPVSYQVNASYYIRHQTTNDVRLFRGSFFLEGNKHLSLSGPIFIRFNRETFVNSVLQHSNLDRARQTLTWSDSDSKWTFDSVNSVIVSFQFSRSRLDPFVVQHQLVSPRHGRRKRRHVTFTLR